VGLLEVLFQPLELDDLLPLKFGEATEESILRPLSTALLFRVIALNNLLNSIKELLLLSLRLYFQANPSQPIVSPFLEPLQTRAELLGH